MWTFDVTIHEKQSNAVSHVLMKNSKRFHLRVQRSHRRCSPVGMVDGDFDFDFAFKSTLMPIIPRFRHWGCALISSSCGAQPPLPPSSLRPRRQQWQNPPIGTNLDCISENGARSLASSYLFRYQLRRKILADDAPSTIVVAHCIVRTHFPAQFAALNNLKYVHTIFISR